MANDQDIWVSNRRQPQFDELRTALYNADRAERELVGWADLWPDDIGFVLAPMNAWLSQMLDFEKASVDLARQTRAMSLERDMERLMAGWRPTAPDLADAPTIKPEAFTIERPDSWLINLVGFVRNVPGGGPDRHRITSPVVAFDADRLKWVRTVSRFYRIDLASGVPRFSVDASNPTKSKDTS